MTTITALGQKALALAALGNAVFPVREKAEQVGDKVYEIKTPYTRSGHLEASTDHVQIERWWSTWPDALVAVNAGRSGLVALDIDMGEDAKTGETHDGWASLIEAGLEELPETFNYKTRRGGDHYVYADPGGINLGPTQDHTTPDGVDLEDVDRRAGSSYFIWWGAEVPTDRSAFASAPQFLLTPSAEITENPFSGTVAEWFDKVPKGEPGIFMSAKMGEIPRGIDFTRGEMLALQASFVAQAAQGETGVEVALAELKAEWLRGEWAKDPKALEDWAKGLSGAVSKFGAVPDRPEDVLTTDQVAAAIKIKNPDFIDLWMGLPQVITEDSLRERVARLMSIAFDEGLSPLEAASLGWHSSAAQHAEHGIRQAGLQALWDLMVHVAENPVGTEAKFLPEPDAPKPGVPALLPHRGVELLTQDEVARRANVRWWGDEFMEEMRSMHSLLSEQYYHLNRWVILSLCFSAYAVIPFDDGNEVPLNIYGGALGPSRSGKTEAVRPVKEIPRRFWDLQFNGHSPDIGGDATKQALATKLLEKSGLPTLFRADEAQSVLRAWADMNGPFSGVKAFVTNVYDGEASAFLRQGQKEDSGKEARVFLSIHFTGIDEEVADAITPEDWRSGAVNRFVWARGQRKTPNREQKRLRVLNGGEKARGTSGQSWYQQWASEFSGIAARVFSSTTPDTPYYMEVAEDVLDRHIDTGETFEKIAQNGPYRDRLEPAFDRLGMTILKCAALVAITKDRRRIQMDDYLIALEQAEEWAENLMFMVEATDESPRARQANRLHATIEREGGRMSEKKLKRMKGYAGDAKYVNGLIGELIEQGRAERLTLADGNVIRVTKEDQ